MLSKQLLRTLAFGVICSAIALSCIKKSTEVVGDDRIIVDIPLDKTAIYATAVYQEDDSVLTLQQISIFSLTLNAQNQAADTTHLTGTAIQFDSTHQDTSFIWQGDITLSYIEDWVLLQDFATPTSYQMFLKVSDTTAAPTAGFQQFPAYPRTLESGQTYSVLRPSSIDGSTLALSRDFTVGALTTWDDRYGKDEGYFISINHSFPVLPVRDYTFYSIVDEHGIAVSQQTFEQIYTDDYGLPVDTLCLHFVNRRLENFVEPHRVSGIETYYDDVYVNRLPLLVPPGQ